MESVLSSSWKHRLRIIFKCSNHPPATEPINGSHRDFYHSSCHNHKKVETQCRERLSILRVPLWAYSVAICFSTGSLTELAYSGAFASPSSICGSTINEHRL